MSDENENENENETPAAGPGADGGGVEQVAAAAGPGETAQPAEPAEPTATSEQTAADPTAAPAGPGSAPAAGPGGQGAPYPHWLTPEGGGTPPFGTPPGGPTPGAEEAAETDDPPTWPGWSAGETGAAGTPAADAPMGRPADPPGPPPGAPGPGGYGPPPGGYPYGYGPYGYGGWGGGWPPAPPGWAAPGGGRPPGGRKPRRHLVAGGAALLTATAVALGIGIGYTVWSTSQTPASSRTTTPSARNPFGTRSSATTGTGTSRSSAANGSPSNISSIASKVDPDLVDINTVLGYATGQAAGTGMVLTSSGEVLTNNHVIEGATTISATDIGNGKTYKATVVGYDRTLDVAVIQLQLASGLQTVTTDTSTASVGEAVVGIGNAGGLGGTPATAGGSVVALNQSITASDEAESTTEHLTGLIETNARIEAGDSGGPLVNASGQVIGMDTAASASQGFTFRGQATGNGYAIPISTAVTTAKQIAAGNGSSTIHIGATGFLGVAVETTSQASRGATGVLGPGRFGRTTTVTATSGTSGSSGAAVARVIAGSPAQKAGVAAGDVITGLGGKTVTSPNSLSADLIPYHPGDSVQVQWTTASGQQQSATLQLASGPAA